MRSVSVILQEPDKQNDNSNKDYQAYKPTEQKGNILSNRIEFEYKSPDFFKESHILPIININMWQR